MKLVFYIILLTQLFSFSGYARSVGVNSFSKEIYENLQYERVIDGDTFVASGKKIRIWGIDAPEKGESYSLAATMYLEVLLEGGALHCKYINTDKYKRYVMKCSVMNNDIATQLVEKGLASDFSKYSGGHYKEAENTAKDANLGIWRKVQ